MSARGAPRGLRLLAGLAALLAAAGSPAHPLAPALLELREQAPAEYALSWRSGRIRVAGSDPAPQWPPDCREQLEAPRVEGAAWVQSGTLRCAAPLRGRRIAVAGLEAAGINVILRIAHRGGAVEQALLDATRAAHVVGAGRGREQPQSAVPVLLRYTALGFAHLLQGADHLLFVLALLLLVCGWRRRLWTVSAFTAGHSLTLGLAVLGWLRVPQAASELAIAASLVVLALRIVRAEPPGTAPLLPVASAAAFGLLHGLGFAGALQRVGLPQAELPAALLGFNLGIELGQLAVIAALLLAGAALQRLWSPRAPPPGWRAVPGYAVGCLGAAWCWGRAGALLG